MLGSKMKDFEVNLTVLDITVLTIHGYKIQQQRSSSYRSAQSVKGNLRRTCFSNENSIKSASRDSGWQAQVQGLIYNSLQDKVQDRLETFQQVAYYKVIVNYLYIKFIFIDVTI